MRLRELFEAIRHSLWFIPAASVVAAAAAALGMLALSSAVGATGTELPVIFGAGPAGARAMLQAIAGSVITVAGVTFSITIVALQLTSTQFSPRVLRNFLRDRPNQVVLGAFMGTFTYALLVLRSIHSADEPRGEAFVPGIAITGALFLAFVSIGMLIYFIHHISVRIQVTSIVAGVARDTLGTIEHIATWGQPDAHRDWRPAATGSASAPPPPSGGVAPDATPDRAVTLAATESGYLQLVDLGGLVERGREHDGRYRLFISPGSWVQRHAPIGSFEALTDAPVDVEQHGLHLRAALSVSEDRSVQQDVAFGIQQLVDIAAKALSPGVNDPTTAMNCIDRLLEVLVAVGIADDPPRVFADADLVVRLEVPFPRFDELVPLAFDQIRHYGGDAPAIVIHLARALTVLVAVVPQARHRPLRAQATLLAESAITISLASDRRRAYDAVEPLLD